MLVFSAPQISAASRELHDGLVAKLEGEPGIEFAAVSLPRAEAMLVPRLIGLWNVLVFIGGSGGVVAPSNPAVLDTQFELLDALPSIVLAGHPADLWPDWGPFQAFLYRTGADRNWIDGDAKGVESAEVQRLLWDRLMALRASPVR